MKNEIWITIFTPTYNRKKQLQTLYESLRRQTCNKFVWLIVDDGSTDNTDKVVENWMTESKVCIQYLYQENAGKSVAHNKGVELSDTELFVCVDSDDYLTENAVEKILDTWEHRDTKDIGILARRQVTTLSKPISGELHTTLRNAYRKYGILGDTMLVYESKIIKKYRFPSFKNEKFVPENYLYDLLDQEGNLFFLDAVLYCGQYLEDGYTINMRNVLKNNPQGYIAYILQRIRMDDGLCVVIPDLIRYLSMAIFCGKKDMIRSSGYSMLCILLLPLAYTVYLIRYKL